MRAALTVPLMSSALFQGECTCCRIWRFQSNSISVGRLTMNQGCCRISGMVMRSSGRGLKMRLMRSWQGRDSGCSSGLSSGSLHSRGDSQGRVRAEQQKPIRANLLAATSIMACYVCHATCKHGCMPWLPKQLQVTCLPQAHKTQLSQVAKIASHQCTTVCNTAMVPVCIPCWAFMPATCS